MLPWMGKQVVHVRAETLLRQLTEGSIALPESHRLPMEVGCRNLSCWMSCPTLPVCHMESVLADAQDLGFPCLMLLVCNLG